MQSFMDLGLSDAVAKAFSSLGFEGPTEIQSLAIPQLVARHDAYISSATGTGKTFAYLAPILSAIDADDTAIRAVIVSPTHDLAAQIERETLRLAEASGKPVRVAMALGSMALKRQIERLAEKPQILVGSAGRIRDLALSGQVDLSGCLWAVLDEADRLFENEAIDITGEFLSSLPASCARALVSATLPNRTVDRSAPWFRDPQKLVIDPAEALRTSIEHWCFHSASRSKLDFLRRFEAAVKPERCLLFASSNAAIFTIQKRLDYLGFPAAFLKSDKDSGDRKSALADFSSGKARWLITTDLGARGLDIPEVSHVISFDLPEEPSVYVHRAGRTGRAGSHGVSIAVADLVELRRASKIAVRYGFPFVCKLLDSGVVHDIEPENFFALAEEEEAARKDVKLEGSKRADSRRRSQYSGGQAGPRPPMERRPSRERGAPVRRAPASEQPRDFGPDQPRSRAPEQARGASPDQPRDRSADRPKRRRPKPGDRPSGQAASPPQGNGGQAGATQGTPQGAPQGSPQGGGSASTKRRHRRRKGGPKDAPKPQAE